MLQPKQPDRVEGRSSMQSKPLLRLTERLGGRVYGFNEVGRLCRRAFAEEAVNIGEVGAASGAPEEVLRRKASSYSEIPKILLRLDFASRCYTCIDS